MREAFHEQLDAVFDDLAGICRSVETAVRLATEALLTGDAEIAEQVISADAEIDAPARRSRTRRSRCSPSSSRSPATCASWSRRCGWSASSSGWATCRVHVAKIARLRVPDVAVPEEIRARRCERMAEVAEDMVGAGRRRSSPTATSRPPIELGRRRRGDGPAAPARASPSCSSDDWTHGVEAAVDIALLGRYYERIADHAVSVANRVVYVVTGDTRHRLTSPLVEPAERRARTPVRRAALRARLAQRPWLATAAAAAAAASGSRYSPPGDGRLQRRRRAGRPAACRSGC